MSIEEEDNAGGIPEWVVTFGDMMSLLLTFFIMLVSFSEIKEEEKYQAMLEAFRQQFGYISSPLSTVPGESTPRNAEDRNINSMGRAKRMDTKRGGDKVEAPTGDFKRVMIVRPGTDTAIGVAIFFQPGGAELTDYNKRMLDEYAQVIQGKPQRVEIRGHTLRTADGNQPASDDAWMMAYRRCRLAMDYLVRERGIDAARLRISVAGPNEPVHIGTDPEKMKQNARVELFMLDEVVSQRAGSREEREERIIERGT